MPKPNLTFLAVLSSILISSLSAQSADTKKKPDVRSAMGWTGVLDENAFAKLHELKAGEAPKLHGKEVKVGGARAYLSLPKSGQAHAAVLVIHEWWGLNDHIKHWSDRLAADGYAALAIDLYGGVVATTREGALEAMKSVDREKALKTLKAAHTFLAKDPRVKAKKRACIGWCFGGAWSLRLAMAAPDLDAAVIYYGRLVDDPEQLAGIRAPVLGVFGNRDRGIPKESVDAFAAAMKSAGKRLKLRRYDANHAFANPSSARYDKANATAAWSEVRKFLKAELGTGAKLVEGKFIMGNQAVTYAAPAEWRKGAPRTMRAVTFDLGKKTQCYVAPLPGKAGGTAANINRWQRQMGQPAFSDAQLEALPTVPALGTKAKIVAIEGRYQGMRGEAIEKAMMLGAVISLTDRTVFVKMIGPKAEVASQRKGFEAFCSSMK